MAEWNAARSQSRFGAEAVRHLVAQPVHLRQHEKKLGTDLRGTLQRGSSGGSHAPDLGPFEVVQGATLLHVMRNVNEQPAVRSVGGSAILSGARRPRGHTS